MFALDSDPRVMRHGSKPKTDRTAFMADFRERLARQPDREPLGYWALERRSDGTVLGRVMLIPLGGFAGATADTEIELGYRLHVDAWGQGYATEAARAALTHAFDAATLDRVVALSHPENAASQNVLRKLGFVETGVRQAYGQNSLYFVIERRAWRRRCA